MATFPITFAQQKTIYYLIIIIITYKLVWLSASHTISYPNAFL